MRVAFQAFIKEVNTRSLVSGDKATRVKLEFDSNDKNDILNSLNDLQKGDQSVMVVIMNKEDTAKVAE